MLGRAGITDIPPIIVSTVKVAKLHTSCDERGNNFGKVNFDSFPPSSSFDLLSFEFLRSLALAIRFISNISLRAIGDGQ